MPLNLGALRLMLSSLRKNPNPLCPHFIRNSLLDVQVPFTKIPGTPSVLDMRIKAVILDKDHTFTLPGKLHTTPAYEKKLKEIQKHYPVLIVSNTAGAKAGDQTSERLAREIEKKYGIPVLRQTPGTLKPLCGTQAFRWFKERGLVTRPREIMVIGDRLSTDVLMGSHMGAFTTFLHAYEKEDGSYSASLVSSGVYEDYFLSN
jgi:phosphatidylglycerophosphatase GEP4